MKLDWRLSTLYVTTIGMGGCWLYTIIALLNKQVADGRLSTIGLLLLYPLAFGIYTRTDGRRIPLTGGSQSGDLFTVTNLVVTP